MLCCSVMSDSFAMPWTVAHKAPLSTGFSRQEYWNGLLFPIPGVFPSQGWTSISCVSCTAGGFFTTEKPSNEMYLWLKFNFQICLRSLTLKWNWKLQPQNMHILRKIFTKDFTTITLSSMAQKEKKKKGRWSNVSISFPNRNRGCNSVIHYK